MQCAMFAFFGYFTISLFGSRSRSLEVAYIFVINNNYMQRKFQFIKFTIIVSLDQQLPSHYYYSSVWFLD